MSDPFQPAERKWGVSRELLKTLRAWRYPVVISTKSSMIAEEDYLQLLDSLDHLVVQVSMSTVDSARSRSVEPLSSSPSELLSAMEKMSRRGINVTSRWQPYIQGFSDSAAKFVATIAGTGAKHVSFEHLKVPVEQNRPANAVVAEMRSIYQALSARRDGREYVLRPADKLQAVKEVKSECRRHGLTFGAGDNELLHLSDTEGCCSGVDQFRGFQNVFRYTVAAAIRKGIGGLISLDRISSEWRPSGSIDRYLNSRSRLGRRLSVEGTVEDHVRYRWNSAGANGNPLSYFGVVKLSESTGDRSAVFSWSSEFQKALDE